MRRWLVPTLVIAAGAFWAGTAITRADVQQAQAQASAAQVALGRHLIISHACGECHGGFDNPAGEGWLQGARTPDQEFKIGPMTMRPRNLTPDNTTGLGRFTERQIFNALRYGLRPSDTPDVDITSTTPGKGNFPEHPHYLSPVMPWSAWRHMSDQELKAIAAYLKRALKPVNHKVEDSDGPPDFWASEVTDAKIGSRPPAKYPTMNER
jgi:mono/diheme cytochrome c family protein